MQGLQQQWDGAVRELVVVWTLRKLNREARCVIVSNPLGWELRLSVGSELLRSEVHRDQFAILDCADAWKDRMGEKGWQS